METARGAPTIVLDADRDKVYSAVAILMAISLSLHDFSLVQGAPSSLSVRWSALGSSAPFFVGGVVTMAYDLTL